MGDVVQIPVKEESAPFTASEREQFFATLENMMEYQERLDQGMKLMTQALQAMEARIRDLEHNFEQSKKKPKPVILNSAGLRVNE